MAYTTINNGSEYFNTVLYTGNGGTQSVIGVGFQPDLVWNKSRSSAYVHGLNDVVRGAGNTLISNNTDEEQAWSAYFTSFDSDGFSMASGGGTFNASSVTYASWNWLGGGTASSNTDGSITSNVSANTDSGFSIVSYTGTGATATVGHGLSQTPEMIIVKLRSGSGTDWITWGSVLGGTVGSEFIKLNLTTAKTTGLNSSWFNNTAPTSSVFTVGTQSDLNGSGSTYIGYCFNSVKGYSKFGSYTGNGNADGTFVYTGFKPAWVLIKQTNSSNIWELFDNKRSPFNLVDDYLSPDASDAETTGSSQNLDFLSNGFKPRSSGSGLNGSGSSYIYMAFAENPLVAGNYVPTTAR